MADDLHALADLVADALDLSGAEISNILDAAPLLNRLPFVPSSNGTAHSYITHTGNPVAAFRSPNAGKDLDSSTDVAVSATLKYLDFSVATDKAVADAWRRGRENYLSREVARALAGAMQQAEQQILQGTGFDAAGFTGLINQTGLDALADAMVVDAGGTTADTASSVWLINEGEMNGVCGVYKGDGPVLEIGDTVVTPLQDGSSKYFTAYYTDGGVWLAMQYGGAYSVSRICNLTADSGKGLTDDLIATAISRHPVGQRPTVAVMSRRSLEQLRQSRTATNGTGAPAPTPAETFGIPIVVTDQQPDTEALEV